MKFRPCIDIHNGKVKQIVGSSVNGESATENFVSAHNADYYANLYKSNNLKGGHIILLNSNNSAYALQNKLQAKAALSAYPNGMQIGGGINDSNAAEWIKSGASHVIITSYVFKNGEIDMNNLNRITNAIGKEKLVLDLSCKKYSDGYYVMTERWQNKSSLKVTPELLAKLESYCDEYLIHAVDVEGKNSGIELELLKILAGYSGNIITYAGGIRSLDDISLIKTHGKEQIDFTVGSALDLFGGTLEFNKLLNNI